MSGESLCEGYIEGDVSLHYARRGTGPQVVLSHGFSEMGAGWEPLVRILESRYEVICYDARGHGNSSGGPSGYRSADFVGDLIRVVESLELRKPFVLGHSMGASTAVGLAAVRPDLVGGLILEEPPFPVEMESADGILGGVKRQYSREEWVAMRSLDIDGLAVQKQTETNWTPEDSRYWAEAKHLLDWNMVEEYLRGISGRSAEEKLWTHYVPQVECPVLLLCGAEEKGALMPFRIARVLAKFNPRIVFRHFPDAGHHVRRDCFAHYVETVTAFLEENS